jgi:hypothetical protein
MPIFPYVHVVKQKKELCLLALQEKVRWLEQLSDKGKEIKRRIWISFADLFKKERK